MTDPHAYRPAPGSIPESPGVYRFRDGRGRVIYVGKAKNLRARLNSYFADFAGLHPRTQSMLTSAAGVDWTVVGTEVEALQLEYSWIKEFDPRFNVRYRDDKSYPYLAVTMDEEYPRVMVMRGARRRGTRYFGPYSHAWAIRETVDTLLRVFPVRTCSAGVFKRARQIGRPCLLGYIGKCSAPCVERIGQAEHRRLAEEFCDFMAGQTARFTRRLEAEMRAAAAAEEFERAARLRDDIQALERALEKQAVVLPDGTDCDVIALAGDQLEAAVQVFYVRGGRVRGQRGWVVDKVEDVSDGELVEHFLSQVYGEDSVAGNGHGAGAAGRDRRRGDPGRRPGSAGAARPHRPPRGARPRAAAGRRGGGGVARGPAGEPGAPAGAAPRRQEGAARHRGAERGRVPGAAQDAAGQRPHHPQPGPERDPGGAGAGGGARCGSSATTCRTCRARTWSRRWWCSRTGWRARASTAGSASRAPAARATSPRCTRSSPAASAGTWRSARPRASLTCSAIPRPAAATADLRQRKFAYPPNLVVIDGGPAQVAAAVSALQELGIDDVAVCGLAKRLEEVWLPGEDAPVILPRSSEGLYLLQRVRDEAHRFAITYHRAKRSKALAVSQLDDVPGLGPARRATLLRHFGSVRRIAAATPEELALVPGIGPHLADAVLAALRPERDGAEISGKGTS